MKDCIQVNIDEIKNIIDAFRKSRRRFIYSSDVIREYCGGFFSNLRICPAQSFNVQFARILARHSNILGISKHRERVSVRDDRQPPHLTTTAEWAIC
jgi:hypothetical protein